MTRFSRLTLAACTATALTLAASSSFAATAIEVVEGGEGGSPMSLKIEPATVAAGPAVFSVHNDAMTEEHEMILVKLKSADQKIPLNTTKHRVDEKKLKTLGEVSDLKPGTDGELKADLKAGSYLLFCNIKGHYEAGMVGTLTVTP